VSAAGSAATAPLVDSATAGGVVQGAIVTTLVGGTLSRLSGGKFANGAVTAAMSYAFNRLATSSFEAERKDLRKVVFEDDGGGTSVSLWSTEDSVELAAIRYRPGVRPESLDFENRLLEFSSWLRSEGHPYQIDVISAYRTQASQDALRAAGNLRAARTSQHTHGQAADIAVPGLDQSTLAVKAYRSGLFMRTNVYLSPNAGVHVDTLGDRRVFMREWRLSKP
jgi:hypothetical protein